MTASLGSSISVVVAAHEVGPALDACLLAYERELTQQDELIVVVGMQAGACERVRQGHPRAQVIQAPSDALTPVLWARGLEFAGMDVVRVTIHPCVPAEGWRAALLRAHADGAVAVGGAIAPGERLRWRDWAILLLRYRSYIPPFERRDVDDVPGDHANYRRGALERTRPEWQEAFWEWEVNHTLVADGARLTLDPDMVATYVGSESARRFFRQRFRHGVRFGRSRTAPGWTLRRVVYVCAFVAPGLVFLAKIVSRVLRMPGYRLRLLQGFGWLAWFLLAWSVGEWIGAIQGSLPPRPARREDIDAHRS